MSINDKRMKVIVVDSVKGGCGKTTISLKYAAEFARTQDKVCYIDLDILGSSIEAFINVNKFVHLPLKNVSDQPNHAPFCLSVERPAQFYLNEMFKGQAFNARFLNKIKVTETDSNAAYFFDLIACNPDQNEKDLFKPSRLMNYVGQIDYEYFAVMIEKMLNELDKMNYKYIIIDMPPNSDAYTDSVFNILLRADETGKKKIEIPSGTDPDDAAKYNIVTRYNVEICVINSFDKAHFEANFAWLKAMMDERRMEWALNPGQNFKIVFNNLANIKDEKIIEEYIYRRLIQVKEYSINKVVRFDYDGRLAEIALKDDKIGFDKIEEREIK